MRIETGAYHPSLTDASIFVLETCQVPQKCATHGAHWKGATHTLKCHTELPMRFEENSVFFGAPVVLLDGGGELIVPAFTALLPCTAASAHAPRDCHA